MAELNDWDVVDGSNNDAVPDGWPEGMNYSEVNDTGRAVQGKLKRFFADLNGSLVGAGSANAYTVTLNAGYTNYFDGMMFACTIPAANTGASTMNVNSIANVGIRTAEAAALTGGELQTGGVYLFMYDGTYMRLINKYVDGDGINNQLSDIDGSLAASGPPNVYSVTLNSSISGLSSGLFFACSMPATNTGSCALSVSGYGPATIKDHENNSLVGGELQSGNIYQFYYDGSNLRVVNPTVGANITLGTEQATTSGSSVTFGSIPANTKRVTIMLEDVSLSTTANLYMRIGDSGGVETSGYYAVSVALVNATNPSIGSSTINFQLANGLAAADTVTGAFTLNLKDETNNTWILSGNAQGDDMHVSSGDKSLSATLTQVEIYPSTGNFDGGSINISYE